MTFSKNWVDSSPIVKKSYAFAKKAHNGQKRMSGGLYFVHVEKTADKIIEWGLDETTVAAALLHDVVEDTPITIEELEKEFGAEITFLVNGVTKLGHIKYRGVKADVENMRKFILAVSKDVRVVIIKLADRLHNMDTIGALPPQKQKRIATETMEIYAPLAYQLGMFEVAGDLEDLAFPIAYPREHRWIRDRINVRYKAREEYAQKIKPLIELELVEHKLRPVRIDSRGKRRASLYRKLLKYEMNIDRVYDLVAIRCIMETIEDCYAALGVIHNKWTPIPHRIKDYIALPKPNGYQSLHTTIFGPEEKIIEVQIRTPKIHEEAENGIAAHWAYQQNKETKHYLRGNATFAKADELKWVEQLRNWQKNLTDPDEFMQSFKINFLENRILTLTPQGKVVDLPRGSTPVDFAYQIHSEVGNNCIGARVNGIIFPLSKQLKSGDVVEILTQKNKRPSDDWLNFVKTSQARNHIKSSVRRKSKQLRPKLNKTEFKLLVEDRIGLLKDISGVISRSHINITDHQTMPFNVKDKFRTIKVCCAVAEKNKVERLVVKLKKLKGIRKIDYYLV